MDHGYCSYGKRCKYSHYLETDEKGEQSKYKTSPPIHEISRNKEKHYAKTVHPQTKKEPNSEVKPVEEEKKSGKSTPKSKPEQRVINHSSKKTKNPKGDLTWLEKGIPVTQLNPKPLLIQNAPANNKTQ
jgi:hypothetical protein